MKKLAFIFLEFFFFGTCMAILLYYIFYSFKWDKRWTSSQYFATKDCSTLLIFLRKKRKQNKSVTKQGVVFWFVTFVAHRFMYGCLGFTIGYK